MRLFWASFLMTGLLLTIASTYERGAKGGEPQVRSTEDGTGFPYPHPTPKTR
jgi:hypothetical protein